MVQKALAQFARSSACDTVHLPFRFTPDVRQSRQGNAGKVLELLRVIGRLLRIRALGRIDLLIYPTGGPQRVPMIRDLLLLPWVFLCSRRVILHFHAAGIASRFAEHRTGPVEQIVRRLYGKAFAAVVMTEFNRRDPEAVGIKRILTNPHHISDDLDPSLIRRDDPGSIRLLSVGHLCADKGTPELLEAVAAIRMRYPRIRLELAGECLPPFGEEELERLLDRLEVRSCVEVAGVLTGQAKKEAFGRADLFVFPSIAPYESFGLVLAEAMSWGLPIVATDWRGNSDVLTSEAGAICFKVSSSLAHDLEGALEQALSRRPEWAAWGSRNRQIFEDRYREAADSEWLAQPILALLRNAE